MKNLRNAWFLISLVLILATFSCEQDAIKVSDETTTEQSFNNATFKNGRPVSEVSALINADNCGNSASTPLIAGQTMTAGEVLVSMVDGKLQVEFKTNDGWVITETQLHVAATLADIPQNNSGSPKIGNFEYKATHNPAVNSYIYSGIEVGELGQVTIAAHAVVTKVVGTELNLSAIDAVMPKSLVVVPKFTQVPSYLQATITQSGSIDGIYESFCVDLDHGINPGKTYTMSAVSSYSTNTDLLSKLVDKPQNLDLVNYVLNTDYSALGATGRELQAVVWTLVDNTTPTSGTGSIKWNQTIVDAIIADAIANGEGYVPTCNGKVVVLLNPGGDLANPVIKSQVTIITMSIATIPASCETVMGDSETAWGQGAKFEGGSWAMYFEYCLSQPTNCITDIEVVNTTIPLEKVNVTINTKQANSYFATTITNGEFMEGTFEGFCMDLDHSIGGGKLYQMYVFSTYTTDIKWLEHYVDKPENFDLVNYIINQDYSALGATYKEIQASIWTVIDDMAITSPTGGISWNQSIVDQIVQDAIANGEGFVPPCNGYVALIMDPNPDGNIRFQVTLIKYPVSLIPNSSKLIY